MSIDKKIKYEMQGDVRNYLGKQKMVKAPLHWQSGPDHPPTELAYITKKEKDLIIKKDLHRSLKGGVNRGPSGIMSLNGWGDKDEGFADKSFSGSERPGTTTTREGPNPHTKSGTSPQTVTSKTVSPKDYFEQSWTGPKGWFGTGGYKDLKVAGDTSRGHKSRFNPLSILGGIGGLIMGIPGLGVGLNAMKSLKDHRTLSDWWGDRKGWSEEEEEETIQSDYQIDPITGKYEYVGSSMDDTIAEFRQKHPLDLSNKITPGTIEAGNFISKVNDPKSIEYGMQLSENQINSMNDLIASYQNNNVVTEEDDTEDLANQNKTNFNQFTGNWYADGGIASLL